MRARNGSNDRVRSFLATAVLVLTVARTAAGDDPPPEADVDDGTLGMTLPVACKEINGYDDFVPLPGGTLTSDEKLLIYVKPRNYQSKLVKDRFVAHLSQDGRIRRKGEKAILWAKLKMGEYKVASDTPPRNLYLKSTVALKGLKPGDYVFEITLHDENARDASAVRLLPFRVVPPGNAAESAENAKRPGRP